jgi:thiamine monophosphate synthase
MTALVGLNTRLRLARLAIVVPPDRAEPEAADYAAHGADLLLFTRGDRSVEEAAQVIDVARRRLFGLQTIVATDSVDVGEACKADVVYYRRPGWRPFGFRRPHEFSLLGRSIDGADQADAVDGDPFSFAFVGPAVVDGVVTDMLEEMARRYPPMGLPAGPVWFAAGGVEPGNIGSVIEAGARRVAVSTSVFRSSDPFAATAELAAALRAAWVSDPGAEAYGNDAFTA